MSLEIPNIVSSGLGTVAATEAVPNTLQWS